MVSKRPPYSKSPGIMPGLLLYGGCSCRKQYDEKPSDDRGLFLAVIALIVAIPAVYRAIAAGTEGNLSGCAAIGTNGVVHLPPLPAVPAAVFTGIPLLPTGRPAARATAWCVFEALFGKKFLFRGREYKLHAAVPAS